MPLIPDFAFETSLLPKNTRYLLGIDEVGRGPWAGPVAVGALLLDLKNFDLDFFVKNKVRDSKTLSDKQRRKIKDLIEQRSFPYKVILTDSTVIDNIGIQAATIRAVRKSLSLFRGQFDFALLDGNFKTKHSRLRSLVKADSKCFSVAAASVVAKVTRDQYMIDYDPIYPGYNFSAHKGYGTKAHRLALDKLGPCPIHRKSYRPIRKLLKSFSS